MYLGCSVHSKSQNLTKFSVIQNWMACYKPSQFYPIAVWRKCWHLRSLKSKYKVVWKENHKQQINLVFEEKIDAKVTFY